MKFDHHGVLVREKPREPGHEIANLGDSCADTCRYMILSDDYKVPFWKFAVGGSQNIRGFVRHPDLLDLKGFESWGTKGFTNDQLIPLLMCDVLHGSSFGWMVRSRLSPFIPGTWKLYQPAAYAIMNRNWWVLDKLNHIQGWLLTWSFRWSDDASDGIGFKSSKGKVQDYPTMICTTIFLNRIGYPAKLPRPVDECINAIRLYRQGPKDFEPNADWEIELYENAIKKVGAKT